MANSITKVQGASPVQGVHLPSRPIYSPFSALILRIYHVCTYIGPSILWLPSHLLSCFVLIQHFLSLRYVIPSDMQGLGSSFLPRTLHGPWRESERVGSVSFLASSRTLHQDSGWKYGFIGHSLLSLFNRSMALSDTQYLGIVPVSSPMASTKLQLQPLSKTH